MLLKPGGWLAITIPNIASLEACVSKGRWYHLDPPYHLCLPAPQAMKSLLKEAGIDDIQITYPIMDYCQAFLFSMVDSKKLPIFVVCILMPFLIVVNTLMAVTKQGGVIEFWGRKK